MDKAALTKENITDMLDAAGYGIGYWARSATVDADAETYTVREDEGGEVHVLTFEQLRECYWKLVDMEQKLVGGWLHDYFIRSYLDRDKDGIEGGHIDSDAADAWVQVAAFGEVVYG